MVKLIVDQVLIDVHNLVLMWIKLASGHGADFTRWPLSSTQLHRVDTVISRSQSIMWLLGFGLEDSGRLNFVSQFESSSCILHADNNAKFR